MNRSLIVILIFSAALASCTDVAAPPIDSGGHSEAVRVTRGEAVLPMRLLAQVPADTPYVWAVRAPEGPEALPWALEDLEPMRAWLVDALAADEDAAGELDAPDPGQNLPLLIRAFADTLENTISLEGMARIGVDLDPEMVIYGLGAFPAARVQLADGARFERWLDAFEARSPVAFEHRELDGQRFRVIPLDAEWSMIVAVIDQDAVAAVALTSMLDDVSPLLLGAEAPARSLAEAPERLEALLDGRATGVGYLDVARLVDGFASDSDALLPRTLRTLSETDAPLLEGVCAQEWRGLAERFPSVSARAEQISFLDVRRFDVTLEVADADWRQELLGLRNPAPSHDLSAASPMMRVAANVDVPALLGLGFTFGERIAEAPYECPSLQSLNELGANLSMGSMLAPAALQGLSNLEMVLDHIEFDGDSEPQPRGFAFINGEDPAGMWALMQQWSPELAEVELRDEVTHANDLFGLPKLALVQQPNAIVAGFGDHVLPTLNATRLLDAPLLSIAWDGAAWNRVEAETLRDADLGEEFFAQRKVFNDLQDTYGVQRFDLDVTAEGLVLRYVRAPK